MLLSLLHRCIVAGFLQLKQGHVILRTVPALTHTEIPGVLLFAIGDMRARVTTLVIQRRSSVHYTDGTRQEYV